MGCINRAHVLIVLVALIVLIAPVLSQCTGGARSDSCPNNPNKHHRNSSVNYHPDTCDLKWKKCTTDGEQKPPPYLLCTSFMQPSGKLPIDWYTFSVQINNFEPSSPMNFTLHGLWPSSRLGEGSKNQPYGCLNGEEFDESYLSTFDELFKTYWPTDPKFHITPECFIMSEWMKHGTCAVIAGSDGRPFRLPQEVYYRTALVLANEYNMNPDLQERLEALESRISVSCVQCAHLATLDWTSTSPSSVPRMSSDCVAQCFSCDSSSCSPKHLDSTITLADSNLSWGLVR